MSEIIIDGCNVAECEFYKVMEDCDGIHDICELYDEYCNTKKNCYFKQLQRAKAELEQYKKDIKDGVGCIQCKEKLENCALKLELEQYKKSTQATYDYLEIERNRLVSETKILKADIEELKESNDSYDIDVRALLSEKDKLKAENEKLKKEINLYNCSANCYKYKESEKYRKALEEIKKIAELEVIIFDNKPLFPTNIQRIIDKINEVLK